jgi:hypothetical protein
MMEGDDAAKKSAARTKVESIKSWIGVAVRAVDAVELWVGTAFVVLFAIAAIVAAIIAAFPVVKSWFG